MKRILLCALTIVSAISCSKSDIAYEEPEEISILPVNRKVTKSVMTGNEFLGSEFKVWAWFNELGAGENRIGAWQQGCAANATSPTTLYVNEKSFIEKNKANKLWGGVTPYYWPKTGSLIFAGYHAPDLTVENNVTYNFNENENFMMFNDIEQTILSDEAYNEDIMYFNITPSSYNAANKVVPVSFKHALSWITLTLSKKSHPVIEAKIVIHDVTFTSVCSKGNGKVENQNTITWTTDNTTNKDFVVLKDGNVELKYDSSTDDNGNTVIKSIINTCDEYLIIPQEINGFLKVRYSVISTDNSTFTETYTVDLRNLTNGKHNVWEPGKHYVYNIAVGTDELMVTPIVNPWEEVPTSILIPMPETGADQNGSQDSNDNQDNIENQ